MQASPQKYVERFSYIFFNPVPFFGEIRYNVLKYGKFLSYFSEYTVNGYSLKITLGLH